MRLIDADELIKDIMSYKTMPEIRKAICEVIDDAPTVDILYLCDTRITDCKRTYCQTDCFLTHDIKHAKNFKHIKGANCFVENEDTRQHGKWEFDSKHTKFGNPYGTYKCSCCGGHSSDKYPYCFWCGAQMNGGEDHD